MTWKAQTFSSENVWIESNQEEWELPRVRCFTNCTKLNKISRLAECQPKRSVKSWSSRFACEDGHRHQIKDQLANVDHAVFYLLWKLLSARGRSTHSEGPCSDHTGCEELLSDAAEPESAYRLSISSLAVDEVRPMKYWKRYRLARPNTSGMSRKSGKPHHALPWVWGSWTKAYEERVHVVTISSDVLTSRSQIQIVDHFSTSFEIVEIFSGVNSKLLVCDQVAILTSLLQVTRDMPFPSSNLQKGKKLYHGCSILYRWQASRSRSDSEGEDLMKQVDESCPFCLWI